MEKHLEDGKDGKFYPWIMVPYPYYSPKEIQKVLKSHGAVPRKIWGQNYLIDKNTIESLFYDIDNIIPAETKSLSEIGIGLGSLTHKILDKGYPTDLYEIDPVSIEIFKEGLGNNFTNYNLIEGDCLNHLYVLNGKKNFIFGNLPYYITSEIITITLLQIKDITGFLFMVQKEFANRMLTEVSSLSLLIRSFGILEKYRTVKKTCFYPAPKIDSTFILFRSNPFPGLGEPQGVFRLEILLRMAFWGKRKKISTSLRDAPASLIQDLELRSNPESLSQLRKDMMDIFQSHSLLEKRPDEITSAEWEILLKKWLLPD